MANIKRSREISRRRFNLRLAATGLLVISLAALGGCRSAPTPESSTSEVKAKTKIAGVGFQDDQFFKLIELGMKDAAPKHDVELLLDNSNSKLDKEITLVDAYISQNVDAICIAPISDKASIAALQRAHDAGIKVITFDSQVKADFPASSIKSDQVSLGATTGDEAVTYIQQKMGGKANVAIISYMALAPEPASQRTNGFKDKITKLPGVKIVAEQDAWMADKAVNVVDGILTANPQVDLIWAANEGGTVGAVTAVKGAGRSGKTVVFGTDVSDQMCDFLLADDNILQAVTGQKPFEIGQAAIDTAVKVVKGETVEKRVSLPGILFSRTKAEEVRKHKAYLQSVSK